MKTCLSAWIKVKWTCLSFISNEIVKPGNFADFDKQTAICIQCFETGNGNKTSSGKFFVICREKRSDLLQGIVTWNEFFCIYRRFNRNAPLNKNLKKVDIEGSSSISLQKSFISKNKVVFEYAFFSKTSGINKDKVLSKQLLWGFCKSPFTIVVKKAQNF